MIDVVLELLNGVLGFLNGVLPDSPLQSLITNNEQIIDALGWLNWFVPISELLTIFGVYLVALVAWQAVDMALDGINFAKNIVAGK